MKDIRWWHRIKLSDGTYTPGKVVHGPDGGDWPTTRFGMPENLAGLSVLDIGAWDGFFSFEAERRGAKSVTAMDTTTDLGGNPSGTAGFEYAKKDLNSNVAFINASVENDPTRILPPHDVVLFYGVLYHLKSPYEGLHNAALLANKMLIVETAINNDVGISLDYLPGHDDDPTNYYYPSVNWLKKELISCGFKHIEVVYNDSIRATVRATR